MINGGLTSGSHCYITMERSTMLSMGKSHYFDWVIFNSYVTNYQRLNQLFLWPCSPLRTVSANQRVMMATNYGYYPLVCTNSSL